MIVEDGATGETDVEFTRINLVKQSKLIITNIETMNFTNQL